MTGMAISVGVHRTGMPVLRSLPQRSIMDIRRALAIAIEVLEEAPTNFLEDGIGIGLEERDEAIKLLEELVE